MRRVLVIVITILLIVGSNNNQAKALMSAPDLFLSEIVVEAPTSTTVVNPGSNTSTDITDILATSTVVAPIATTTPAATSSEPIGYLIPTSSISTIVATEDLTTITAKYIWSQIKINEIVSDPEDGNEWVELYNLATSGLNLAGGVICDNTGKSCKTTTGTIGSVGWLVVDLGTNRYLNNDKDSVILKNPVSEIIDSVSYGLNLSAPIKGQSLTRKLDGIDIDSDSDWSITIQPTAGSANMIVVPSQPVVNYSSGGVASQSIKQVQNVSQTDKPTVKQATSSIIIASTTSSTVFVAVGQVIISELFPDPLGSDNEQEYIAIKNLSSSTIDLQGWRLSDSARSFALSGYILPEQTIIWERATTSLALNNTQPEVVSLVDWQGQLVDKVNYDQAGEGQIYKRVGEEWWWVDAIAGPIESHETDKIEDKEPSTTLAMEMNLAQVRKAEPGELVKVSGIVSVLPGVFASHYYYITDSFSGIQVYNYQKEFPVLAVGDKVEVTGEVSEAYGMKRIKAKDKTGVVVKQRGLSLAVGSSSLAGLDESRLGGLIKIKGIITELKSSYMYVDDGSGEIMVNFKTGAKIDAKKFKKGENIEVIGILEQGRKEWQLWPRSPGDIKLLSLSEPVMPAARSESSTVKAADSMVNSKDAVEKYLAVSAGGAATLFLGFLIKTRGMFVWRNLKKMVNLLSVRFKDRS